MDRHLLASVHRFDSVFDDADISDQPTQYEGVEMQRVNISSEIVRREIVARGRDVVISIGPREFDRVRSEELS